VFLGISIYLSKYCITLYLNNFDKLIELYYKT
jgi:hypothetical protein